VGDVGTEVAAVVTGIVVGAGVVCSCDGCVHPAIQIHRTRVMPTRIQSDLFMHRGTVPSYKMFPSIIPVSLRNPARKDYLEKQYAMRD